MLDKKFLKLDLKNMSKEDLIKLTNAAIDTDFVNTVTMFGEITTTAYMQVLSKAVNVGGEVFAVKDMIKKHLSKAYEESFKEAQFEPEEALVVEVATAFAYIELALRKLSDISTKMGSEIEETVKALGVTELGDVEPEPPEEK